MAPIIVLLSYVSVRALKRIRQLLPTLRAGIIFRQTPFAASKGRFATGIRADISVASTITLRARHPSAPFFACEMRQVVFQTLETESYFTKSGILAQSINASAHCRSISLHQLKHKRFTRLCSSKPEYKPYIFWVPLNLARRNRFHLTFLPSKHFTQTHCKKEGKAGSGTSTLAQAKGRHKNLTRPFLPTSQILHERFSTSSTPSCCHRPKPRARQGS